MYTELQIGCHRKRGKGRQFRARANKRGTTGSRDGLRNDSSVANSIENQCEISPFSPATTAVNTAEYVHYS